MALGRTLGLAAALAGLAATGCVDRRFVIESNVPDAQVFIDNKHVGAAPAYSSFEYYGHYTVTLVQPGYETLTQRVHVTAPWYGYPPFDFFAEVLWPFHIRDTRRYFFELHESTQTRVEDLLNNAEVLRMRGQNLPPPARPAVPKPKPGPQPGPQPGPDQLPPPQPLPPGTPILPPVGPVGPAGPTGPAGPATPPGLVPSVFPTTP